MATLHDFLAAPVGRWAHAPPMLVWSATPKLCGIIYTGLVGAADVPRLTELTRLPLHADFERPYRAILDCAGVTGIDTAVFPLLVEHSRELANTPRLFDRVAYIVPSGMAGATALGVFHKHLAPTIDMRFVDDLDTALALVEGDAVREELLELRELARGAGLLASLRGLLREDPRQSLDRVAARLGVSTRTLQRACTNESSSYRDEAANARFAFADTLLRSTTDKLEAITRRAGYRSAASFTRRFRDTYGVTVAQFRATRGTG